MSEEAVKVTSTDITKEVRDNVMSQLLDLKVTERQIQTQMAQLNGQLEQVKQSVKATEEYLQKLDTALNG